MPYLRTPTSSRHGGPGIERDGRRRRRPAFADARETEKTATATGYGGAVSTVDPEASAAAIEVLRKGGNAADAAVAAAATLGVTEPYSAGIGGGGYFVFYNAQDRQGAAPSMAAKPHRPRMPHDAFIDPATGKPYNFTPELVTSGVSVGVPGTPATWERALDRWGTWSLDDALKPAIKVADRGFVVDNDVPPADPRQQAPLRGVHLHQQASSSPAVTHPPSAVSSRTPTSPTTYRLLADKGTDGFYRGPLAAEIAATVQAPPKTADHHAARSGGPHDDGGSRRIPRPGPGAHARGLPRPGRLRHGAVQQRRHHRGRGAEHPGAVQPFRDVHARRPAPLPRGQRACLRGPRQVRGRPGVRRRSHRRAHGPAVRQGARLPDRPAARGREAGGRRGTWPRTTARARPPPRRPRTRRTPRTSRPPT